MLVVTQIKSPFLSDGFTHYDVPCISMHFHAFPCISMHFHAIDDDDDADDDDDDDDDDG